MLAAIFHDMYPVLHSAMTLMASYATPAELLSAIDAVKFGDTQSRAWRLPAPERK